MSDQEKEQQGERTIIGNAHTYNLHGELGNGATSVVYKAIDDQDRLVALKVLRQGLGSAMVDAFFSESDLLRRFKEAEAKRNDGIRNIPTVYETQRDGDNQFLALELVDGEQVSDILNREPYYMSELRSLKVMSQVTRVLDILHTDLDRSYKDYQMKNILVDQDDNVKVIDWNHVSDRGKGNPADDIARTGDYLYHMVTGKEANIAGETERQLERRAGERWGELSLGMRRILLKTLHPNLEKRYATAADMKKDLDWLIRMEDPDQTDELELIPEADELIQVGDYQKAEILVDIAERRGVKAGITDRFKQKLDAIENRGDNHAAIRRAAETYFKAGDYGKALSKLNEVAFESGRLEDYRRIELAKAGCNSPREFQAWKEAGQKTLAFINEGKFQEALTLKTVTQQSTDASLPAELENLFAEAEINLSYTNVNHSLETGDNAQALELLEDIDDALALLPDQYRSVLIDELGLQDRAKRIQELQLKTIDAEAFRKEQANILRFLEHEDETERLIGITMLTRSLEQNPTNQAVLQLCINESYALLSQGKLKEAAEVIEVAQTRGQGIAMEAVHGTFETVVRLNEVGEYASRGNFKKAAEHAAALQGDLPAHLDQAKALAPLKKVFLSMITRAELQQSPDLEILRSNYRTLFPEDVLQAKDEEYQLEKLRNEQLQGENDALREQLTAAQQEIIELQRQLDELKQTTASRKKGLFGRKG